MEGIIRRKDSIRDWTAKLSEIARLARSQMTLFSAVTYLCGAVLGGEGTFDLGMFFRGYLFVFLTQLATHYLGEYFDAESDRLNQYSGGLTGGSKVLAEGNVPAEVALWGGWILSLCAAVAILVALPHKVRLLASLMLFLANQYSAGPLKLNHRALGELDAAIITNWFLPVFAYSLQVESFNPNAHFFFHRDLVLLIVPPALLKVSTFLVLNLADRRADWQSGKITLAVILDDRNSARLYVITMIAAYLSAFVVADYSSVSDVRALVLLELTLPLGLLAAREVLFHRPYRCKNVVALALLHSPSPVWALLFNALLTRVLRTHSLWDVAAPLFIGAVLLFAQLRTVLRLASRKESPRRTEIEWRGKATASSSSSFPEEDDVATVIVLGARAEGLCFAACLQQMGVPFLVLEKDSEQIAADEQSPGLCLLSSDTIKLLHALGVKGPPGMDTEVVEDVDLVGEGTLRRLFCRRRQTQEDVVRCESSTLLRALRELVPRTKIQYEWRSQRIEFLKDRARVTNDLGSSVGGRMVVAADGMDASIRHLVFGPGPLTTDAKIVEGVTDLSALATLPHRGDAANDKAPVVSDEEVISSAKVLKVVHEVSRRREFVVAKVLDDGEARLHWLVRQRTDELDPNEAPESARPSIVRRLLQRTHPDSLRTTWVQSSNNFARNSKDRVILLGNSASTSTSSSNGILDVLFATNKGIQDAVCLATIFREYAEYGDGHAEAFYRLERNRLALRGNHRYDGGQKFPEGISNLLSGSICQLFTRAILPDELISRFEHYRDENRPLLTA